MKITIHIEYDGDGGMSEHTLYDVPADVTEEAFGATVQKLGWRAYENVLERQRPVDR